MRNAIVLLLLAVMSTSAAAGWVVAGKTEVSTIYVDRFMPQQGDVINMWNLSDFNASKVFTIGGPTFSSIIRQEEFNCKEERMRTVYLEFNTRNMGRGDVIYSRGTPGGTIGAWTHVGPGSGDSGARSTDRLLFDIACRKG